METSIPFYAYKETRLELDPATQGSSVAIRLPAHGVSTHPSKGAQKRSNVVEIPVAEDENAFRQRTIASAASIFYRSHHKSPRSFLWRVLEDGKVLSIQCVDVFDAGSAAPANITLRLTFPSPIRPGCIAFADSKDRDVLNAFILTESKQLYTISLIPDHFRKQEGTDENVGKWCKTYSSAGLGIKAPHRLVALGADELLISMVDGGMLRLEKNVGGDGAAWKEVHYNEGGWNLRLNIFKSGNSIQYRGQNLELSAATSIASPETIIDGMSFAFTVCLDHRLRVWNLSTGKVAYTGDILGQDLESPEHAKNVIDPSQSQLVKIFGDNNESALCVTYSPLGVGQFKFWNVTPGQDGSLVLEDIFPNNTLEPQAPSSEIWTLADFSVVLDKTNINKFTLWALWKNNVTYRLHQLSFQSDGSVRHVQNAWNEDWMAMATETLREASLPSIFSGDSSDGTDKWLHFILYPGRFTVSTLETGLAIYGRGLGAFKSGGRKSGSLPDRMCSTIASTASLSRSSDGDMDYDQFRGATDAQWRRFYRLLLELDKQRGEAMSLAIDPRGDMPWVVLADGIAAIRDCSPLERIWHNNTSLPEGTEHVARPLFAAALFRNSLSESFLHSCKSRMLEEILNEASLTPVTRMRMFYDKCDFANQIGDDEYQQLVGGLGGSFKNVTLEVYTAIIELMHISEGIERAKNTPLAEFGRKMLVKGVQETVELHRNICLDQLILLVLIEGEINHGEEGIQIETSVVFNHLMKLLKSLELLDWLSTTQLTLQPSKSERSNSITDATVPAKKATPAPQTVTVLEGIFRHLFGLDLRDGEALPPVVTEVLLQICVPDSRQYEAPPAIIQCFLLTKGRPDLAMEFSRFGNDDPFSTYIQGRVCLAANDVTAASLLFKNAAYGMAYPNPKTQHHAAGFLDETEKNLLNTGLPEYYSHIVALFDKEKHNSFVIDFARLSLQFIKPGNGNANASTLRKEMHSRLFNAAIQTARFEVAHSVLALFTDSALQHSSLRTLITKMCETSHASQLTTLPFLGLQDNVDEILAQKCQSIKDVNAGIPYHKILYSWRIKRSDFRGAASISLERLQRLQQSGEGDQMLGEDGLETPVTKQYVALINALSCVEPKHAWILFEEPPVKANGASVGAKPGPPKRSVVTLEDVRRGYQSELDRIAAIQNNQFAFGGGDEMDVL